MPRQGHEVEIAALGPARVGVLVHAQQAHDLEGNGPQGQQAAEGDATGQETPGHAGVVDAVQPGLREDLQRQLPVEAGAFAVLQPLGQAFLHGGQRLALGLVHGLHQGVEQFARGLGPAGRRGGLARGRPPALKHLEQRMQGSGQRGVEPAHFAQGFDAPPGRCLAVGIPQQHAAQREGPAALLPASLQPEAGTLPRVQAPARARCGHPAQQQRACVGVDAEARGDGRHFQQLADLAEARAVARDAQHPVQRQQQRTAVAPTQVGDVEGDVARVAGRVLAEDRAHGRGEDLDVGHHDHDVPRAQRLLRAGIARQQLEQSVVQHLDLAQGRVRDVELDGVVGGGNRRRGVLGQRQQVADRGLHMLEQAARLGLVEHIRARQIEGARPARIRHGLVAVQLAHEVAALAAPGREQRVRVRVHGLQGDGAQLAPLAQRQKPARRAQQLAPLDDVGPVEATGIGHGDQHLRVTRQRHQQIQHGRRQRGRAEQAHPRRQAQAARRRRAQAIEHPVLHLGAHQQARLGSQALQQLAPQQGLPALALRQDLAPPPRVDQQLVAARPGLEPVGPVDLVLIVEIGQALRQLQQAQGLAIGQEGREGLETRRAGHAWQQRQQAPDQGLAIQRRARAEFGLTQHGAADLPHEARGQLDPRGGADALRLRLLRLEPLARSVALHQHQLRLQRRQGPALLAMHQQPMQGFQAISVQHQQPARRQAGAGMGLRGGLGGQGEKREFEGCGQGPGSVGAAGDTKPGDADRSRNWVDITQTIRLISE